MRKKKGRKNESNRNSRITESTVTNTRFRVSTAGRDNDTLFATADVRERSDVKTGRSLSGLSVRTAGGRRIRFSGHEARTLLRVLETASQG